MVDGGKNLRVSVLGGRGMLGSELCAQLRALRCDASAFDLPECDITRSGHVAAALAGADAVVNCAAYTNVDRAEDEPEAARAVNATAVGELGRQAAARGLYVLHISTDFVFDGAGDRPYDEACAPAPLCVYGMTKLEGERALAGAGCRHAIVRVQWSYGFNGVNFPVKLIERAAAGGELRVVDDQVGAPTWTRDIARALTELLLRRAEGLYHFANAGYASRYETAVFIAGRLGLSNPVIPCRTADFPVKARRPLNSRFDTRKIRALLCAPMRPWQDALGEFLGEYAGKVRPGPAR